ncbi:MAG TPA: glycosyltransferase family 9 protein [Pyrinomonadaceae bacterium]|jgi:ADP-heptose:LPS heptosyltransferase|nr:glycosyltransferase family 9 protein [Pyrinomonadaceae bacterium]
MSFDPRNILVIDFGQLGDVVLSLPALRAVRERFPRARITVAVGSPGAPIVELSGYADATLVVDRVALRDGPKPLSIMRIMSIVKDVRRAQFDFVIDLHSLYETNLLGYLSGAPRRLYARRPNRSLDFLANFDPRPPVEDTRPSKHAIDRYLDVLIPLGIKDAPRVPRLRTRPADDALVEQMLKKEKADTGAPLIGLFPGAGHPARRWPLARFKELAERLVRNDDVRMVIFAGPEERAFVKEMRAAFPRSTIMFDRLTIPQLAAALARLAVFVSNDTGPLHIATAVGTGVVALLDRPTPHSFIPIEPRHRIIYSNRIAEMTTDEVYAAARELLAAGRTASLFAS